MKPVKFTDTHRFTMPYQNAEETRKPGYLARRFQRIRAEQAAIEAEKQTKVQALRKAR